MKTIKMMTVSILAASLVTALTVRADEVKSQGTPPAVNSTEKSPVVENGSKPEGNLSKKEQRKMAHAQKKAEKKALKKKNKIKS